MPCPTKKYVVRKQTTKQKSHPHGSYPPGSRPHCSRPHGSYFHSSPPHAPVHMLLSICSYPHAPVPHVPVPHAPIPHAPVSMLPSLNINHFNNTKTNHFNHTIKKIAPVLILRSTFSGISRTFTIFILEAMWCGGSNPHGVEALWSSFCPECKIQERTKLQETYCEKYLKGQNFKKHWHSY